LIIEVTRSAVEIAETRTSAFSYCFIPSETGRTTGTISVEVLGAGARIITEEHSGKLGSCNKIFFASGDTRAVFVKIIAGLAGIITELKVSLFSANGIAGFAGGKTTGILIEVFSAQTGIRAIEVLILF